MKLQYVYLSILALSMESAAFGAFAPKESLTDFRIRSEFQAPLNANTGWAGEVNESTPVHVDQPFRIRMQIESSDGRDALRHYVLWYRRNNGPWEPVVEADFPYPLYASPVVSIVKPPYEHGASAEDLLPHAGLEHGEDSAGQGLAPVTPRAGEYGVATEWEFPLVVRFHADGPIRLEGGDEIEFQLGLLNGGFIPSAVSPKVQVLVPEKHLGGTFVETPGRIGPWQAEDGSLYFIMEPTETDNRFMMVKSTDDGDSWTEVDGDNRPPARDLEAVDAVRSGNWIHILHMEDTVWYHAFRLPSANGDPEGWVTQSELISTPTKPPVQSVGLETLSDGTLIAFHADGPDIKIRTRLEMGEWPVLTEVHSQSRYSGIQVVRIPDDRVYFCYTDGQGNGWLQFCRKDGSTSQPMLLSANMGVDESDIGSILTPVFTQDAVSVVFRESDGRLYERRLHPGSNVLSDPTCIVDIPVLQNAVDSDQTCADLIAHNGVLHLFFVPAMGREILHTHSSEPGIWSDPQYLIRDIQGSWIRANGLNDERIGFVYDAGSLGGSGMNRFGIFSPED